jgi:hypothetical protein
MIVRELRERPLPWRERRVRVPRWTLPFFALEWIWDWLAFLLSRWTFVVVLEYLGSLSILVAVFFYIHDAGKRTKQRHYQAWQVINTAQGKGGSGGRLDALQELNEDGVPLVGVDVSGSFLQGVRLHKARLIRSNFSASDVRNSDFSDADFEDSELRSANFRQSNFANASLAGTHLDDADLQRANLSDCDLSGSTLDGADLRFVTVTNLGWQHILSIKRTNLFGVRNPPSGFIEWATKHGAVQIEKDQDWDSSRPSK